MFTKLYEGNSNYQLKCECKMLSYKAHDLFGGLVIKYCKSSVSSVFFQIEKTNH